MRVLCLRVVCFRVVFDTMQFQMNRSMALAETLEGRPPASVTARMFISACKAVNYRVILTQLVTF